MSFAKFSVGCVLGVAYALFARYVLGVEPIWATVAFIMFVIGFTLGHRRGVR